ncbi:MAG: SPASM domain-containing protein [Nannocystis sp.]|nr:SPASM domain-containing protein [Nannocystis sp.]
MGIMNRIHFYAYRYNYTRAPKLKHKAPIDVSLELASQCNQACSYCYHAEATPFKKGMMSLKTAQLIIVDAAAVSVPSIKLNWKGESTLNPHFYAITEFAKEHADSKTFIERLTNSNFKFPLHRDDIFKGLLNQTKVKVSFDSFIPGVMEKQRAGSNPALAEKNISHFYAMPNRKTEIVIQAVRTQLNKDEDLEHEVKKRWPSATVSIRDMVAGRVENNFVEQESIRGRGTERQSCVQAHARLIFNWDGTAFPCCVDITESMPLGNIREDSIFNIFNGEPAKRLRTALLDGSAFKCGACKGCSSFESYKGYKAPWLS